jgi:molybdate transport system substrate-binding protein
VIFTAVFRRDAAWRAPTSPHQIRAVQSNKRKVEEMRKSIIGLMAVGLALAGHTAAAAEFTVLSGGAIEPGLKKAAEAFEKSTGHTPKITFNTAPQITKRIGADEKWDVVIAPTPATEDFAKSGRLTGERAYVGKVGMGVAIRPGAPVPDISSVDTLKKAIVDADSITFNRASTGMYFEGLLKKWGIYDKVEGKTTRYADGASVMEHVLAGKGKEIGFGPVTEILLQREHGLKLVGPLPEGAQNYTSYTAVASGAETARGFVKFLSGAEAKAIFASAGIDQ